MSLLLPMYRSIPSLAPSSETPLNKNTKRSKMGKPIVKYVILPVSFGPKAIETKVINQVRKEYPTLAPTIRFA